MTRTMLVSLTLLLALPFFVCGDTVFAPEDLQVVLLNGVEARSAVAPSPDGKGRVLRVEFEKPGDVRRMVAVTGTVRRDTEGGRVVVLDGELHLVEGQPPRLCAVLFGRDGQRWIRKGVEVLPGGGRGSWSVSVARMQAAAFAETHTGAVAWPTVERVWVGLVFDAPAKGRWDVRAVRFTNESPPALVATPLMQAGATGWRLHHDASVKAQLATSEGGPAGQSTMRVTYTFPGGRHMYCTCSLPVSTEQPELYRAVRLTYRASFPAGIAGMLFILAEEGGACYIAEPMPGPSVQWRTVTVPYSALKRATWTPDANSRFDPETLTTVWVGTHGTADGEGGPGRIEVAVIELVP